MATGGGRAVQSARRARVAPKLRGAGGRSAQAAPSARNRQGHRVARSRGGGDLQAERQVLRLALIGEVRVRAGFRAGACHGAGGRMQPKNLLTFFPSCITIQA